VVRAYPVTVSRVPPHQLRLETTGDPLAAVRKIGWGTPKEVQLSGLNLAISQAIEITGIGGRGSTWHSACPVILPAGAPFIEKEGTMKFKIKWALALMPALALAMPAFAQDRDPRLSDSQEPGSVIVFPKFIQATVALPEGGTAPRTEIEIGVQRPPGLTLRRAPVGQAPVTLGLPRTTTVRR